MKTSFKIFSVIFLLSILFVDQRAKAQTAADKSWRLGFGVEDGIPTGDLNGYAHFENCFIDTRRSIYFDQFDQLLTPLLSIR